MSGTKIVKRDTSFDVIRILACFLVVIYHSRYQLYEIGGGISTIDRLCLNASFFIGRLAVPMFFIMSGYFTFPIKGTTFSFLSKRFERIISPFIAWVAIYAIILSSPSAYLHNIVYLDNAPQMWYLYALMGVTLLIPIISAYFSNASRKEYLLYLGIWAVTLVFNGNYFDFFNTIETNHQGLLFTNPVSCLLNFYGYLGYIVLGAYLKKYGVSVKESVFCIAVAVMFLAISLRWLHVEIANAMGYCTIVNALFSITSIVLIRNLVVRLTIPENTSRFVSNIGKLTFGVYLNHWLIFQLLYKINYFNTANCIITSIVVFLLSLFATWLLSMLPKSKYIIG